MSAFPSQLRGTVAASSLAIAIDSLVGDEPLRPHPVALFGNAMSRLERLAWADQRLPGVGYALSGVLLAGGGGALLGRLPAGRVIGIYTAVAGHGLWSAAGAVAGALERRDLPAARSLLPALVGRDPSSLDETEVARAVVESVAENTVDAIVAPALFGAAAGATGALAYRAVNTLDSMVGYRSARYGRFGWASARLDDLANYAPARVTAALVAAVQPASAKEVWRAVREDAPAHPSPNAGVSEAAFGAALGLRLGGTNTYDGKSEHRALAGALDGRPPEARDIARAVSLSRQVAILLAATMAAWAMAAGRRAGRSQAVGGGAS